MIFGVVVPKAAIARLRANRRLAQETATSRDATAWLGVSRDIQAHCDVFKEPVTLSYRELGNYRVPYLFGWLDFLQPRRTRFAVHSALSGLCTLICGCLR